MCCAAALRSTPRGGGKGVWSASTYLGVLCGVSPETGGIVGVPMLKPVILKVYVLGFLSTRPRPSEHARYSSLAWRVCCWSLSVKPTPPRVTPVPAMAPITHIHSSNHSTRLLVPSPDPGTVQGYGKPRRTVTGPETCSKHPCRSLGLERETEGTLTFTGKKWVDIRSSPVCYAVVDIQPLPSFSLKDSIRHPCKSVEPSTTPDPPGELQDYIHLAAS